MLISAAKFARKYFYEDKNNGGVLIFFIAVSLLVEVAKLLVINFFKAVNKNQNIFTIFDNFSLVRDQIKILTLYRSFTFENSRWRATPTSKYVSPNLSRALGEAGFYLIMKCLIFHIGAPRRLQG